MNNIKDIKIIEALLFASSEPLDELEIKEKILDKKNIKNYLDTIQKSYEDKGINLKKNGNKWSFRTSSDLSENLTIFKKKKRKISRAALETLAIIAYHQPITRSEIENIRGVQMGRGSIDLLMQIGWIMPRGRKNIPGKPTLWSTTNLFLEHFSIESLNNLPSKDELKASGFLEKRSAISTITDLAKEEIFSNIEEDTTEDENLEDFISENR